MPNKPEKIGAKAAETTTAVNGLVGFRRSEVIKSFGLMAGYAAKQPKPFAKHIANYVAEMIEVAKGTSELAPDRKDRRFRDCLLYTSPSPRDLSTSRMPSSA